MKKTTLREIEEWTGHKPEGRQPNGILCLIVFLGIIGALIATCSGCAEYPVAIRVQGEHGTYGYSKSSGFTIDINATK